MSARLLFRRLLLISAVASMITPTSRAQVSSAKIDALVEQFTRPRDPGCAVLIIQNGNAVFQKGYGVTDLWSFAPIGPETNFRLASLTKQFTAMAVMLLAHDGKLHYEDRLTDVFPDFGAYGRQITIRHLLNHTSGLIDYEDILDKEYEGIADGKRPQIKDAGVLELLKRQSKTRFAPGTHWAYSNSGYALLAMIVEKKSGLSFGEFLRTRIFLPAGMSQTVAYEKGKNEVPHRAYGHTQSGAEWHETDQSSTSAVLGDGGIYSSLNDLAKWERALAGHALLSEKEMASAYVSAAGPGGGPLTTMDGKLAPLYGFGWFLDSYHGHRRYSHYGETVGFRTAIQRFPSDRLTVVVLCNRAEVDAPDLAEKIAGLYLGKP